MNIERNGIIHYMFEYNGHHKIEMIKYKFN